MWLSSTLRFLLFNFLKKHVGAVKGFECQDGARFFISLPDDFSPQPSRKKIRQGILALPKQYIYTFKVKRWTVCGLDSGRHMGKCSWLVSGRLKKAILPLQQDFLVYIHPAPIPAGSCSLLVSVRHQWAMGLEEQVCWLDFHWFRLRVCRYDQEGIMALWQSFPSKGTFYLHSGAACQGQLHKEMSWERAHKWEPELQVGFRWKLLLCSHIFLKILTVKQVFLQLDKHQHIYKTTYAGTSAGVSCFGPVSLLWLAVWSRPTASQTVSFCLSKWVYGLSVTAQCGTCETFSKNSQHLLGCELYALLCVLLGLSGTVMFINPPTTQEIFCALESAHLVSIQGIKSRRGWDAAQGCGKAGLSLHVRLLHYTSPSYIH